MNVHFEADFIAGLELVARRRYWRRECWDYEFEDVLSQLVLKTWDKWMKLKHSQDSEKRIRDASYLAHKVRRSIEAYLNRHRLRKEIPDAQTRD